MSALFDLLNRSSSALLDLDPDTRSKFADLEGRIIGLEVTSPALNIYLAPGPNGIEVFEHYDGQPDVTLSGPLLAFVRLGTGGVESRVLSDGQLQMRGNAETGQAFQKILSQLDLDWEELLSRYSGDTLSRKVGNLVRGFDHWARQSADLSRENIADYLQEEKRVLVTPLAMARFKRDVQTLRSDVDRAEQRIANLRRKLSSRNPSASE